MTEHRVPAKVYITEEEYRKLLRAADGQTLHVGFAGEQIWVEESSLNRWALTLLVKWRGVKT